MNEIGFSYLQIHLLLEVKFRLKVTIESTFESAFLFYVSHARSGSSEPGNLYTITSFDRNGLEILDSKKCALICRTRERERERRSRISYNHSCGSVQLLHWNVISIINSVQFFIKVFRSRDFLFCLQEQVCVREWVREREKYIRW